MSYKKNNYVHGNNAEKIEYNVYEKNKVLKAKKRYKSYRKAKTLLIVTIVFFFAIFFSIMWRYGCITQLNKDIETLTSQYSDITSSNITSEVKINRNMSLAKVREYAISNLGMQEPDEYQITYLNIPKDSYSVISNNFKDDDYDDSSGFVALIFEKIGNFF